MKDGSVVCDECGYDGDAHAAADLLDALREAGPQFAMALAGADTATIRTRPERTVWSALEYTAHTRDAVRWYGRRIHLVLTHDQPQLTAFDWDAACEERQYAAEDPADAVSGLTDAAHGLADTLAGLSAPAWERTGVGSGGGGRTVLVLARRAVHEVVHHLMDVQRGLRRGDPTAVL